MNHVVRALAVLAVLAGHAAAQSQPGSSSALAEQLFNQGRDLVKADQWAEACPKFEASLRYDPVLGTRLNLATCYEHIGKLASAWGLYRESMELAKKSGDTKRADYAQRQATALEPRLPKLTITVSDPRPTGLAIKRDDTAVDAGAYGVALYVDPGAHKVTASAPGFEAFAASVTLVEGKAETVAIPALTALPAEPVATTPVESAPVEPSAGPRKKSRIYLALGLGAGGVALIAGSVVAGVMAHSSYSDAKKLCGDGLSCPTLDAYNRDKDLVHSAHTKASIGTGLFIGGVAAIGAAAVVYFTAPREVERAAMRVVPVPHDGGAGLALTGAF